VVQFFQVSRSFGNHVAIANVTLSCEERKTTVLLGPSGSGKSTLLRLAVGLAEPDSGRVTVDGDEVSPESIPSLRQRMGYVIQEGGLFPHLNARRNVGLLARHVGWSAKRIRSRISELTGLVRLEEDRLDRYPVELSGGQRQRVAVMRALMLDPPVLLLDEPLGALDPMIRRSLQDDLRVLFRDLGKTVVMVTHDLAAAGFLGDTVALLRAGRIEQMGAFNSLIDSPATDFVQRFVQAQRREA